MDQAASSRLGHGLHHALGQGQGALGIGRLDHDAQQGLGATGSNQYTALLTQFGLHACDFV